MTRELPALLHRVPGQSGRGEPREAGLSRAVGRQLGAGAAGGESGRQRPRRGGDAGDRDGERVGWAASAGGEDAVTVGAWWRVVAQSTRWSPWIAERGAEVKGARPFRE